MLILIAPAALHEIGFQNKIAVRIDMLLVGPMNILLNFLALLPAGMFFVFLGLFSTGFVSVAMYRPCTGTGVSF